MANISLKFDSTCFIHSYIRERLHYPTKKKIPFPVYYSNDDLLIDLLILGVFPDLHKCTARRRERESIVAFVKCVSWRTEALYVAGKYGSNWSLIESV